MSLTNSQTARQFVHDTDHTTHYGATHFHVRDSKLFSYAMEIAHYDPTNPSLADSIFLSCDREDIRRASVTTYSHLRQLEATARAAGYIWVPSIGQFGAWIREG